MLYDGPGGFDTYHFLETLAGGLGSAAVFFVTLWRYHKSDVKEREEKAEKERAALLSAAKEAEVNNEERHQEQQKLLSGVASNVNELATNLKYHPPHVHVEKRGPLTAEGIFPPYERD